MPLVSVITPLWRTDLYEQRAYPSLCAQTFTDWEAIPVTDAEVGLRYGECDNALKFWAGVGRARGQLIAFLNDDDEYLPHHLDEHLHLWSGDPFEFSITGVARLERGAWQASALPLPPLRPGMVDTNGIVCSRELVCRHPWRNEPMNDFHLVKRWRQFGARRKTSAMVTAIHHCDTSVDSKRPAEARS